MTTLKTRLLKDQDRIRFWINLGCDIIAANTIKKDDRDTKDKILENWGRFRESHHSIGEFEENLKSGKYDKGIAILCGMFQRGPYKGKCLNIIDFDRELGIREFLTRSDKLTTMQNLADEKTLVEYHEGDENSYHLFVIADVPLKRKSSDSTLGIEIKGETGLMFVSPSMHSSLKKYKPLGKLTEKILELNPLEKLELEQHIDTISKRHGVPYLSELESTRFFDLLERDDTVIQTGSRHNTLTHIVVSYFFRWGHGWEEFTDEQRYERVLEFDRKHCVPPLQETNRRELESLWDWVKKTYTGKRQEEQDQREDEKKKNEEAYTQGDGGYSKHKYEKFRTWDEIIKRELKGDRWTQVSETPLKLILADSKGKHMVRVTVAASDNRERRQAAASGTTQRLSYSFNRGAIIFKCIPTEVIVHRNPLHFLRSTSKYTIKFVTQSNEHFVADRKTIDEIVAYLKQRALNISAYGVTEALNAIIQAFEDDGLMKIDESVEFTGFYLDANGMIRSSNIPEIPINTKEELAEVAKILNNLSSSYSSSIDLFSMFIKWAIVAPFSFVLKQNGNAWLKWLHEWGQSMAGKTTLGTIVLAIDNHHQDFKFILSYSRIDSLARFGEAISKTTYPLVINEVYLDEKQKHITNLIKTAVESAIVRSKFMDKTIPTDIPALSACIFTGNPPPPKSDTAYMRRVIDREFSKQECHNEDDEKTKSFEIFLRQNRDKLYILGNFRIRWILEHQKDLILDRKLKPFDIGQKVLEDFFESAGIEKPTWIHKLLPENQMEEAEKDVEALVRRALIDMINNTFRSYIGTLREQPIDVSIQGRFRECCDKGVFAFIRKRGEGDEAEINIDTGIMHELWNNPRYGIDRGALSGIRALGDVIGFTYGKKGSQACNKDNRSRVIYGKESRLMTFLNSIESEENNS
ncbi:MAG: hypothetical protein DLM72_05355 [Candidatus Nitrosopolaris wilkensis]|nr:MAG: hypothetical protein DLM72_05355 [Candidatus Nitrosopolaris wilkensis]